MKNRKPYEGARIYYTDIINNYSDTQWAAKAAEKLQELDENKEMKNKILKSALICFFLVLAGCGYTTRSMISDKYKTIYITPFVNKTDITSEFNTGSQYHIYRPHLETDVTTAVVNKFLFDGNLKPVKMDDADMVLKGELLDFRKDPLRYDNGDNVLEYRVSIVVNLSMWDKKAKYADLARE